ncbi:hypothetical protein KCU88_g356, partial [Aureobasidium melanogenum]
MELLFFVLEPANQETEAQAQQQIGEDGPEYGGLDNLDLVPMAGFPDPKVVSMRMPATLGSFLANSCPANPRRLAAGIMAMTFTQLETLQEDRHTIRKKWRGLIPRRPLSPSGCMPGVTAWPLWLYCGRAPSLAVADDPPGFSEIFFFVPEEEKAAMQTGRLKRLMGRKLYSDKQRSQGVTSTATAVQCSAVQGAATSAEALASKCQCQPRED